MSQKVYHCDPPYRNPYEEGVAGREYAGCVFHWLGAYKGIRIEAPCLVWNLITHSFPSMRSSQCKVRET